LHRAFHVHLRAIVDADRRLVRKRHFDGVRGDRRHVPGGRPAGLSVAGSAVVGARGSGRRRSVADQAGLYQRCDRGSASRGGAVFPKAGSGEITGRPVLSGSNDTAVRRRTSPAARGPTHWRRSMRHRACVYNGRMIMASRSATDEAHRLDPALHSTADAPALAADSDARPIRARRRDGVARLVWVVLALVVLAALAYFLWQKNQSREAIPPVASAPAEVAPPAADAAP